MTKSTSTIDGWTWTSGIGIHYGSGPEGQRETVQQPVMTSPWWTIGSETLLVPGVANGPFLAGAVSLIFSSPSKAIRHVLDMHRPPLDVEPEVTYRIWVRDLRTGERRPHRNQVEASKKYAHKQADAWNTEEKDLAYMEMRSPKREFFVVKAVTTFETDTD